VLVEAVAFSTVIVAVHIMAVVVTFGYLFAEPVLWPLAERIDRAAMPLLHRLRKSIGRWLINPGLLAVIAAGIYLASDEHQWKAFFVQWALGVAIVLGGLEGSYVIPKSGRLAEIAERDLAAGAWSDEYVRLRGRVRVVGGAMAVLVLVTIYIMTVQPGRAGS
jgi:hypothetical protein